MSTTDALSIVSIGLQTLNLPAAVREALAMLSSGISAAFADGPLAWGDIYLIAVTLYISVVVAEHWDDIINIFKQAYREIRSEITVAFNNITSDIDSELNVPSVASVRVNNKDVTINGVVYRCSVANSFIGCFDIQIKSCESYMWRFICETSNT